nr:transposase [Roseovarius sp. M141]
MFTPQECWNYFCEAGYRPVTICTDEAPGHRKVIQDLNHCYDPHFDSITPIDHKWRNNRIESDHVAWKRLLGTRQSFRYLRSAKVTLMAVETIRTIKNGHIENRLSGIRGENRAKVGDALRGGISWRCRVAVNSQPRKGYATCQRIPSPNCPIHWVFHPIRSPTSSVMAHAS